MLLETNKCDHHVHKLKKQLFSVDFKIRRCDRNQLLDHLRPNDMLVRVLNQAIKEASKKLLGKVLLLNVLSTEAFKQNLSTPQIQVSINFLICKNNDMNYH